MYRVAARRRILLAPLLCLPLLAGFAATAAAQVEGWVVAPPRYPDLVEGKSLTFGVELRGGPLPAGAVETYTLTMGGVATPGADYTLTCGPKQRGIDCAVANDSSTATFTFTRNDLLDPSADFYSNNLFLTATIDGVREPSEEVLVTMGYTHRFDIVDPPPVVGFASATGQVREDDGPYGATFSVDPPAADAVTVPLRFTDGTAEAGNDYVAATSVTIPADAQNQTLHVELVDDDAVEADETFTIAIDTSGLPSGVTAGAITSQVVTILDDDAAPPVVRLTGGPAVSEGGDARFTLHADPAPDTATAVNVTVTQSGSFAASGQTGTRQVSVGSSGAADFTVATQDDDADEPDGSVTATIDSGAGYAVGTPPSASVTVNDNDEPPPPPVNPKVAFASPAQSAGEGDGTRGVTINLSPAPAADITLNYSVGGTATAGSDYRVDATALARANQTTATIAVQIIDDSVHENSETVVLTLTGGSDHSVGSPSVHTLTIADDDPATEPDPEPVPALPVAGVLTLALLLAARLARVAGRR